jgi:hypothetical protein
MSLLLQFFKDQAKKTRPGVSLYLFEALMEVSKSLSGLETLKVDTVFQKVIKLMINSIDFRKNITFSTIEGMQANVDLLGGKEFDSKYIPLDSPKNDDSSLIDNHFFYLKNPRSQPNLIWMNHSYFLTKTFRPWLFLVLFPKRVFQLKVFLTKMKNC